MSPVKKKKEKIKPAVRSKRNTEPKRSSERKPNRVSTPSHDQISERAYQLWQERGQAHGHDGDDWREAEAQLTQEE